MAEPLGAVVATRAAAPVVVEGSAMEAEVAVGSALEVAAAVAPAVVAPMAAGREGMGEMVDTGG